MANWVYNIKVYDTDNLVEGVKGHEYKHWKPTKVDSLQFTPKTMRDMYSQFEQLKKENNK